MKMPEYAEISESVQHQNGSKAVKRRVFFYSTSTSRRIRSVGASQFGDKDRHTDTEAQRQ